MHGRLKVLLEMVLRVARFAGFYKVLLSVPGMEGTALCKWTRGGAHFGRYKSYGSIR